jgi:hypothetical protein
LAKKFEKIFSGVCPGRSRGLANVLNERQAAQSQAGRAWPRIRNEG